MKLRIKGNSLRIRLTKSEVDYFDETGYLEEKTEFGDSAFIYALQAGNEKNSLLASFSENKLIMIVPKPLAKEWTTTNLVGIEREMEIGNGRKLFLLLEKDFKCLDNTTEDQSDNYENPLAAKN